MRARFGGDPAQPAHQRPGERLVQQRALARPAHPRDAHQCRERELHADVLEIVGRHAFDRDRAGLGDAAAVLGDGDFLLSGQVAAGQRGGIGGDLCRRALGDDAAAMPARPGPKIHQPIGTAHDRLVVLDHHHRVAARLQVGQGVDQPPIVAGMESDRRLVEHVADADQSRAEPGRQPHALQLAAAEAAGRPIQRQVAQAHAIEEFQPRGDLAEDRLGDRLLVVGEEGEGRKADLGSLLGDG